MYLEGGSLEALLGIGTAISTIFKRSLVMALRTYSMPIWHMVSNPAIQVVPAGEEDTRDITSELLQAPSAGEPCDFAKAMMGIISDVYGITFDACCFLCIGRHSLNLGDDANRLATAGADSRLLIDPLPPRLNHIFTQANFIGNESQSQAWNKRSSLTYNGASIAPNMRLKDMSFPTTLGTLQSSPQALFYHQVATQNGIAQAAAVGFETKSYRSKQDEEMASSRSGAELLSVGNDNIRVPISFSERKILFWVKYLDAYCMYIWPC